jgi:hypothetical protein
MRFAKRRIFAAFVDSFFACSWQVALPFRFCFDLGTTDCAANSPADFCGDQRRMKEAQYLLV